MSPARIPSLTNTNSRFRVRCLGLSLMAMIGLALFAVDAGAACSSFQPPPELYVGDMASDAACTQNDIQSAIDAATCIYGTKIFITREHTYTTQGLDINNKNITLIGRGDGLACGPVTIGICDPLIGCPPPPTSPLVEISGKNGAAAFAIGGTSNVGLVYLDILNAQQASGFSGGGIAFSGSGSLTLDTTWVRANHATGGGGISFVGAAGTPAVLNLRAYTQILANIADDSGGGILVAGNSILNMLEPHVSIDGNTAGNVGGGIDVVGPANANIGTPDDNGAGVIRYNKAAYGGGIAITAPSDDNSSGRVRLFTVDPTEPVGITNNTASHTGGGIYLKPHNGNTTGPYNSASLCAWDFRIESNGAVEGAAIYSDVDTGLFDSLGGDVYIGGCYDGYPSAIGAVACTNSTSCNTINSNYTNDPTQGSVILIQDKSFLDANRFAMRDNTADHAIRVVGFAQETLLFNCLFANNTLHDEVIYVSEASTTLEIGGCTFANDSIGSSHAIHIESDLKITSTIVDEPGTLALDYSGNPANLVLNYIVSNDVTTLPAATGVVHGEPSFVDFAGGDYHLRPGQFLGVDFAPAGGGPDLDGHTRNVDLSSVVNAYGPRDVGAYELQNAFLECGATDSVFCDGFDH